MLKEDTLRFVEDLKQNNNREWFTENKSRYECARDDFEQLVVQIISGISTFDPELRYLDPRKCMFRIYRDLRFSEDKSPYKTHFGATFRYHGLDKFSGYYFHLEPNNIFISCGYYTLTVDQLKTVKRGIFNDFETFISIINEKNFKEEFGDLYRDSDTLLQVPRGFDKNHPSAKYMKLKRFYVYKQLSREQLFDANLVSTVTKTYKLMCPLLKFLNDLLLDD